MKIVAAGFFTALMIFAVATAMSELLWTADEAPTNDAMPRRKSASNRSNADGVRSQRSTSRTKKSDTNTADSDDPRTGEIQGKLSEIRQRESEVKARQDALRIVYEEIREEQQTVEQLRRRVSDEIALFKDAALRFAMQERRIQAEPQAIASTTSSARPITSPSNTRPIITMKDMQTVRDTAVLVNRLAQQGSLRAATSLLRRLQDRDAARVLAELDATDSEMALRLTKDLQANQNDSPTRR